MEDFVGAKITVHMPFLVAISAFRLGRRLYSSPGQDYLHLLMTDTWRVKRCIIIIQEIGRSITTITEDTRGDNIPFPMPFHGAAKRKCSFFPQHHGNRVNCLCNHNFVCLA